jgi:hypothetical protein
MARALMLRNARNARGRMHQEMYPRWERIYDQPWRRILVGVLSAVLLAVLSRDLFGRDFALLLGSYHVETFLIAGLLFVVMRCRSLPQDIRP